MTRYPASVIESRRAEPAVAPGADKYIAVHHCGWMMHDEFLSKQDVVGRILSNEFEGVAQVLKLNIADGFCSDVSADFSDDVFDAWRARYGQQEIPEYLNDFFDYVAERTRVPEPEVYTQWRQA